MCHYWLIIEMTKDLAFLALREFIDIFYECIEVCDDQTVVIVTNYIDGCFSLL